MSNSSFVTGNHHSYAYISWLHLWVQTSHNVWKLVSFWFSSFSTGEKVIVPHLQKNSELHEWFDTFVVKMFYDDQNREWIDLALTVFYFEEHQKHTVCYECHLLLLLLHQSMFFYVYCEDLLLYGDSSLPVVS